MELVDTYLSGSPFYNLLCMKMEATPVVIDPDVVFSGVYCLAAHGRGKTTLLKTLIEPRLHEKCSIIIFDSKPELATAYRHLKLPKQTVIIDPHPNLSLNPLRLGTHNVSLLMQLFGSLQADFTPRQSTLLRNVVHLCTQIKDATLRDFRNVVATGADRYADALAKLDEEDQDFWTYTYPKQHQKTAEELAWRIDLIRPPDSFLRSMFNAPTTKVNMAELMDTNTLTIINNSRVLLDEYQCEFFSRMFLVMILAAAEQRAKLPDSQKNPCFVFIDEADIVVRNEEKTADIIQKCRSQKISLCIAHQSLSQITNEKVRTALADCAVKYMSVDHDAPSVAALLGVPADTLRGMHNGRFALSVRGRPTTTVQVTPTDHSKYPRLTPVQIVAHEALMRETYHYTPAVRAEKMADPSNPARPTGPVINVMPTEDP